MAAVDRRPALLIVGGAGYIGSHVCKAAAEAGYLPIAYDDLSTGHRWAVKWGPLEVGDIQSGDRLSAVLARWRPKAVIHLAGLIISSESVSDPAKYYQVNVAGTLSLLARMRETGIDKLIFSSSAAVYGSPRFSPMNEQHPLEPISPYGYSKLAIERFLIDYARAYRLSSVSLRYFNAGGADWRAGIGEAHPVETHLIPLALEAAAGLRSGLEVYGTDYQTPDGTCIRDYVHVADLAQAHIQAVSFLAGPPGAHAFNLGSEAGSSVREVIAAAEAVTGTRIPIRLKPRREGDPAILLADATQAKQVLGWEAVHNSLHEIIESAWAWHREAWAAKVSAS